MLSLYIRVFVRPWRGFLDGGGDLQNESIVPALRHDLNRRGQPVSEAGRNRHGGALSHVIEWGSHVHALEQALFVDSAEIPVTHFHGWGGNRHGRAK